MRRSTQGFTLTEVLLAVFLMAVALLAAVPMFTYAMRETATGADLGYIGAAAVDRMEILRESDFNSLTPGGNLASSSVGYSSTSNPAFTVRWQIVANATPATLKTISVRVIETRTTTGLKKDVTLTTLRAK